MRCLPRYHSVGIVKYDGLAFPIGFHAKRIEVFCEQACQRMELIVKRLLRPLIPGPVKSRLRAWKRDLIFRRAMRRFLARPPAPGPERRRILSDLIYGWGNENWSAQLEYLEACIDAALDTDAPILECGSGLTTLLIGAIAQRRGYELWTLEHSQGWGDRVRKHLTRCRISAVNLVVRPLRSYSGFTWYDPPLDRLPDDFGLVICDGPPAMTPGGRYGLLPVMRNRLATSCTILLDDAHREREQAIAAQWAREIEGDLTTFGVEKPYFVLRLR